MGDLLARFGSLLVSFHPNILDALLPQLASPRLAVRKRTIVALSHLVVSCSPQIYARLMDFLIEELAKNSSMSTTRTYIQCIAAIRYVFFFCICVLGGVCLRAVFSLYVNI